MKTFFLKTGYIKFPVLMAVIFLFTACATAPKEEAALQIEEQAPEVKPEIFTNATNQGYTPTNSEEKSLQLFNEIYKLVSSSPDKKSVLPEIEKLYLEIITKYPDAPLAKESYWRLVRVYMYDYSPPAFQKAELRYQEFSDKYPQSQLIKRIQEVISKGYYRNSDWNNLLRICTPEFNALKEKGQKPKPSLIYMYSEANFHLGNIEEAIEGYRALVKLYSRTNEGRKASIRLKEIEGKRSQIPQKNG
jgi:tetratricopeptide (TPR) repeat protein